MTHGPGGSPPSMDKSRNSSRRSLAYSFTTSTIDAERCEHPREGATTEIARKTPAACARAPHYFQSATGARRSASISSTRSEGNLCPRRSRRLSLSRRGIEPGRETTRRMSYRTHSRYAASAPNRTELYGRLTQLNADRLFDRRAPVSAVHSAMGSIKQSVQAVPPSLLALSPIAASGCTRGNGVARHCAASFDRRRRSRAAPE